MCWAYIPDKKDIQSWNRRVVTLDHNIIPGDQSRVSVKYNVPGPYLETEGRGRTIEQLAAEHIVLFVEYQGLKSSYLSPSRCDEPQHTQVEQKPRMCHSLAS